LERGSIQRFSDLIWWFVFGTRLLCLKPYFMNSELDEMAYFSVAGAKPEE
jgi:hypothetical protein